MKITDYLRDTAHAIDIGESEDAAVHARKLREAATAIDERDRLLREVQKNTNLRFHPELTGLNQVVTDTIR